MNAGLFVSPSYFLCVLLTSCSPVSLPLVDLQHLLCERGQVAVLVHLKWADVEHRQVCWELLDQGTAAGVPHLETDRKGRDRKGRDRKGRDRFHYAWLGACPRHVLKTAKSGPSTNPFFKNN